MKTFTSFLEPPCQLQVTLAQSILWIRIQKLLDFPSHSSDQLLLVSVVRCHLEPSPRMKTANLEYVCIKIFKKSSLMIHLANSCGDAKCLNEGPYLSTRGDND